IRGEGLSFLDPAEQARNRDLEHAVKSIYRLREGTFIDVGANIGQALWVVVRQSRDIPYVGFEPNIHACYYVAHRIGSNGLTRHHVLPIGLSRQAAVLDLMLGDEADVSASVNVDVRSPRMYPRRQKVVVEHGDTVLERLGLESLAVIKTDIEGEEYNALLGLAGTVQRFRPFLIIEVSPYQYLIDGDYNRRYFTDLSSDEIAHMVEY